MNPSGLHPDGRARFTASIILRNIGFESIDAIAGGETAGIPFAAWIADRLMLPMQYVRKKPKGFGKDAQIEGTFSEGDTILLVEDLTTDGRSLKKSRCNCVSYMRSVLLRHFSSNERDAGKDGPADALLGNVVGHTRSMQEIRIF